MKFFVGHSGMPIERIVRPPLDGEYRDPYDRYAIPVQHGRVTEYTDHMGIKRWSVWYISWRNETAWCTETWIFRVGTASGNYAQRLGAWLRQPENIRAHAVEPSLPMDETEQAQAEAGRLAEQEWRRLERERSERTHQMVMCMFPELRDLSYRPTPEVVEQTTQMASILFGGS